jgi:hypothetical protein
VINEIAKVRPTGADRERGQADLWAFNHRTSAGVSIDWVIQSALLEFIRCPES